ncbi:hypothetical protein D3C80_1215130 [compost metagenome]
MLGLVVEEALFLGGQPRRGRGQQPLPVGLAREQFGVPPDIARLDRRLLGRTHPRHDLAEARHGRARQDRAAQRRQGQQQERRRGRPGHDRRRRRRDQLRPPARRDPDSGGGAPERHPRLHQGQDEGPQGQRANPDQHGQSSPGRHGPPVGPSRYSRRCSARAAVSAPASRSGFGTASGRCSPAPPAGRARPGSASPSPPPGRCPGRRAAPRSRPGARPRRPAPPSAP